MDTAATGIYSAAYTVGSYALALGLLGTVLYPNVIKTYDEGQPEQTANCLKYLMTVAIPAAFGLSLLAGPLLNILTTAEFADGNRGVPLVAFGAMTFCLHQISIYVIHVVNKTHLTVRLLGFAALLSVGLNVPLIPRMGIMGAAIATLAAYGVLELLTLAVTRRYLRFDLSLPFVAKSIVAAAVMALRPTAGGAGINRGGDRMDFRWHGDLRCDFDYTQGVQPVQAGVLWELCDGRLKLTGRLGGCVVALMQKRRR